MKKNILYDYSVKQINSLVFKISDYCDQGCSYCYRENNLVRPQNIMSNQIIFETINKYILFIKNKFPNRDSIYLIWHGGEPLLAGLEKFEYIVKIEKEFSEKYNIKINNAIQTNGVTLNDSWCQFFERENFLLGFSLDGPKEIHDLHRKNKAGTSTFDKTLSAIIMAQKYNITCNLICVITNESYNFYDKIYKYIRDLGIKDVDFIPCFSYYNSSTLRPEFYTEFMLGCLNLWEKDDFRPLEIRFLADVFDKIDALTNEDNVGLVSCELAGACGQNFSIGANGEVNACECLTPINEFFIGNINSNTFEEMLESKMYDNMISSFNDVSSECFECEISTICEGGCLNRRFFLENTIKKDIYCESRKAIIKRVIKIYDNNFFGINN